MCIEYIKALYVLESEELVIARARIDFGIYTYIYDIYTYVGLDQFEELLSCLEKSLSRLLLLSDIIFIYFIFFSPPNPHAPFWGRY